MQGTGSVTRLGGDWLLPLDQLKQMEKNKQVFEFTGPQILTLFLFHYLELNISTIYYIFSHSFSSLPQRKKVLRGNDKNDL